MNVLMDQKIDKIRINMERIRWLPADLGKKYIMVNLPEYSLKYFKDDTLRLEMKIIIGEIDNYTPILMDTMKYIVFNPLWNVPRSIASDKMLKNLKSDRDYYKKSNFTFLRSSYSSGDTVATDSIDWNNIPEEKFPYYVVQESGKTNSLGLVKFMFPNNYHIYLHDTPREELFQKQDRDLSHGCIRLDKPLELAEMMLKDQDISGENIQEMLMEEKPDTVYLQENVMVHFVYHTAWVDDPGNIYFRDDVYGLDKKAISLLYDYQARKLFYSFRPNCTWIGK
ncbi:MAG: L,D-transpeptidase family protein [Cyclobacteriaceae bacterium]|nr:L,D-transpeptidase family protein [Cyclobacteriaceae bacterium]